MDMELLSSRVAARQLARLPLERACAVLAEAPVGASAGVLEELLAGEDGEGLVISLLAGINRDRGRQLVAAMPSATARLEAVPDAAQAIEELERKERVKGRAKPDRALGESTGRLERASVSPQGTEGYYQSFENGHIHWSVRGGAQVTRGSRARYHTDLGGSGGPLGFPLTPPTAAGRSPAPFNTEGSLQRFEGQRDYPPEVREHIGECGATVYWSAKHGPHATWGSIGARYELEGGTSGWLGFPVSDEAEAGPSHRNSGAGTAGWCQRFEGGVIYYSAKTKAVAVPSGIADYHQSRHGAASSRGFPVSRALEAAESRYGTTGQYQRFEGTEDYPEDILKHWTDDEGPGGATIYTSDAHGTYCVGWGNGVLYERLGGTGSWLGFPESDETDARTSPDEPWCTIQEFEGGAIFFKAEHGSVTVTSGVMDYLARSGLRQRMGFPVRRDNPLAAEDDEPVQFFEYGVVTIRKGKIEAWLRPDDPTPKT